MRRRQIMSENLQANIFGRFNETWKLQGKLRDSSALLYNENSIEALNDVPQEEILVRLINSPRG